MGMFDFLTKSGTEQTSEQEQKSKTIEDLKTKKIGFEEVSQLSTTQQLAKESATTKTDQQIAAERAGTTEQAGTQQQTTQQQLLSTGILDQLETQFGERIAAGGTAMSEAVSKLAAGADFDVGGFVSGITGAADRRLTKATEGDINLMASATGGGAGTNSAVAALAQELRLDKEASLAGIGSEALKTGTEIQRGGMLDVIKASQAEAGGALDIAQILKGAKTTGEATGVTTATGATTDVSQQAVTGTQEVDRTTEQVSTQESQIIKQVQELMEQLGISETEATASGTQTGEQTGSLLDALSGIKNLFKKG